jgi:hypothetical protein
MMQKQQGMTLIGMLLTGVAVVMAGLLVMRIVPVYLQHYSIVQSIKSLNTSPVSSSGDLLADVDGLREVLNKRLEINGVEPLNAKQIIISPDGEHQFIVQLKYQVVKPLVYNINLLFQFDETYKVVSGSEN